MDDSASARPATWIEKARSGRSRCRVCRRPIARGKLRFGVLVDGAFGPGYLWHHLRCALRRRPDDVEDAYRLRTFATDVEPPPLEVLRQEIEKAGERRRAEPSPPYLEIAPSGRSRCRACSKGIERGAARLVLAREVSFGNQVRTGSFRVHPGCAAEGLADPECATPEEGLLDRLEENPREIDTEMLALALDQVRRSLLTR